MNKERRNRVSNIVKNISILIDKLEEIKTDEEFAFDSMPENLQYSFRGEESQEAIEIMDEAIDKLNEAIESLEEIQ